MTKPQNGKGDKRRPYSKKEYDKNYERIFGKKKKEKKKK